MTYSLFGVHNTNKDGTVNGNWIQDHIGDLQSATAKAVATEATNSNKIDVAVVDSRGHRSTGDFVSFQKRLDQRRIKGFYDN